MIRPAGAATRGHPTPTPEAAEAPSLVDTGHPAGTALIAVGGLATLGGLLDMGLRGAWMQPPSRVAPVAALVGGALLAAGLGVTLLTQP